jgi:hypothetical protein
MPMRALSAAAVLELWERGANQPPLERALELVAAACPEIPREALPGLSIGRRDAALFALREHMFGPEMAGLAACPRCETRIELTVNASEVRSAFGAQPENESALQVADYELRFRPPNSADLMAARHADAAAGRELILSRCLLSARRGGAEDDGPLPAELVDAVMEGMARADPLADLQLTLDCPQCRHRWRATFDIVSFLWREIEAAAARVLLEVHRLASAYGWGEREILGMTAARRQSYLAMVGE